ncbi:DnaJ-domain-containing protein [Jackrogersella minutella]|nr:DnaJ-domain-containing protein [Jackrogersella minutella]
MARPSFPKHDLYKILGIESTASLDDIKKTYRELCKKVHPDKAEGGNTPENNNRFQKVQEAWEILRDEVLRREYDQYRASNTKGSSEQESKDADAGRRRKQKERKPREERTGKSKKHSSRSSEKPKRDRAYNDCPGDTYEARPNSRGKPYCEKWGEEYYHDGENPFEQPRQGYGYHPGAEPSFYGAGPTPGPKYHNPYNQHHRPRSSRGPPPIKLEDNIITMRIRVDLNQASRDLDNLQAEFKSFTGSFIAQFELSDAEERYWGNVFRDVDGALEFVEDLYDDLHLKLQDIELGHETRLSTLDLPELLGILQAHITRMKYSLTAALIIMSQLISYVPYEAERRLFEDLGHRLWVMAWATLMTTDHSKPAR